MTCREHLRAFIRLPVLQGPPRANDLQRMSNVTHETLRQLKAQGLQVETWDMIIVHMLHERLDPETARQWELQRYSETPTVEQMTEFLDKQADALQNVSGHRRQDLTVSVQNEQARVRSVRDQSAGSSGARNADRAEQVSTVRKMPCEVCFRDHPIWQCPDFEGLNVRSKKDFVERRNLCQNCLKKGHNPDTCYMDGCYRCPGKPKHNQLLCPKKEANKQVLTVRDANPNMQLRKGGTKRKEKSENANED